MQNVSRIQKHPDTLIKNFFIGGLTQRKLQSDIFPKDSKKKQDMFNLEPEMLFSLYEEPEKMAAYLGQVFPDKVRILQTEKMVDPKFFTFMSVDAEGFNQYNHCLIFYERFTENLIREDFDEKAYIERLVRRREKIEYVQKQKEELAGIAATNGGQQTSERSPSDPQDQQAASFGRAGELRIARKRMDRVFIKTDHLEVQPQDDSEKTMQELTQMKSEIASRQTESGIVKRQFTHTAKDVKGLSTTPTAAQMRAQMGKSTNNIVDGSSSPLTRTDRAKNGLKNGYEEMKQGIVQGWNKLSVKTKALCNSKDCQQSMPIVNETAEENMPASLEQSTHKLGSVVIVEDDAEDDTETYRDSLFGQTRQEALSDRQNNSSTQYNKRESFNVANMEQEAQKAAAVPGPMDFSDLVKANSLMTEQSEVQSKKSMPEIVVDQTPKEWRSAQQNSSKASGAQSTMATPNSLEAQKQVSSTRQSEANFNPLHKGEYYFAPIAFVVQTEVEHHDIFKEVLLSLFESIRQPEEICDSKQKDRQLAFADFLCHLAFLSSIPCPTFNTRYHIEFFGKTLTVAEPNYDEIPDKNQLAIRVLFDMLDVRTIIYCWKAILFDQTLVLISSQYSLQFYIAQALLQLVFPLTFQYSYVQPASSARIGMVQSPFPILFACSHLVQDFEYFEELGKDHIAICDIDGSYTNNLEFPQLEDEKRILRSLSALKNFKGAKFDSAFHEMYQEDLNQSDKQFTIEVRNVFFGILDQFLTMLPSGDYFRDLDKDQERAFINYFDQDLYLDEFQGTKNKAFAERLMNSQLFATFCDDHFDRDVSNMLIYLNISSIGFDFEAYDEKDSTMKDAFEERMANIWKEIEESNSNSEMFSHSRDQLDAKLDIRSQMMSSKRSESSLSQVVNQLEKENKTQKQAQKQKEIDDCTKNMKCELIKEWPKFQKIDICWRMPQDNQRVMIFEKLEYALKCYDRDRQHCNKYMDQNEQLLDDNHREHMNTLFKKIKELKRLYREKLPTYTQQIKWASKDLDNSMSWGDNTSVSQSATSPLQALPGYQRLKTQIDKGRGEVDTSDQGDSENVSNQTSETNKESNNLMQSQQTNVSQSHQELKFLQLTEIENNEESVDMGQLNKSTRQKGNYSKSPVKFEDVQHRQRSQHQKRGPAKDFVQATHEFAQNQLKMIGEEQLTMAEIFWRQREENVNYFCRNRIVEICYGLNGLIDFLDLLFTQFPSKRQVKTKFNYYFALRKQIQAIENQVTNELIRSENLKINAWFTNHKGLLEQLQPQVSCMQTSTPSIPELELNNAVSIVFQGCQKFEAAQQTTERATTSFRLWDMQDAQFNSAEVQGRKLDVFKQENIKNDVWMLPVLPEQVPDEKQQNKNLTNLEKLVAFRTSYQYISLKQKLFFAFEDQEDAILLIFGEFLLFSQNARQIFPTYRFYELLEVMTQPQKNRIFKKIVKHLNTKDQQMFQLRLMFEHERNGMDADKDEPCSLDHTLFDQDFLAEQPKRKVMRPSNTVEMSKTTPDYLALPKHQQTVTAKHSLQHSTRSNKQNSPCMTKRKTTNQEVQHLQNLTKQMQSKIKRDKNKVTTTGQGTTKQIQGISPRTSNGKNQLKTSKNTETSATDQLNQTQEDGNAFLIMSRSQAVEPNLDGRNLALNGTITTETNGQYSVKSSMNFDKDCFMRAHGDGPKEVVNPEKRAKQLLLELIDLYTEVFDPSIFSEVQQKIIMTDAIPHFKEKLKKIRKLEQDRLSSVKLVFEGIFQSPEAAQDQEIIKRCFWINLFNYKILMKVLEVLLTKPRTLHRLTNCTMFVCFMSSIKVKINGHEISCYEIFKTMLKHQDIHLLTGAFEDPVRTLEQMPAEIQSLAVQNCHSLASFGLFLPIKKWCNFTVFEKETFEAQLRKVIQSQNERMFISPDNFLIRIPKFFFRVQGKDTGTGMRFTQTEKIQKNDAISLLKNLVDENIIEPNFDPGSVYNSILTVLNQIENEERSGMESNAVGEQTSHVCEIDNFWWKFDLLFVRSNIREYCEQSGRSHQPIKSSNDQRFSTIAEVNAESKDQPQQQNR